MSADQKRSQEVAAAPSQLFLIMTLLKKEVYNGRERKEEAEKGRTEERDDKI